MNDDLLQLSAAEIAARVRARRISATGVVRRFVERCDELNPTLNIFVARCDDLALAQAQAVDEALARGAAVGPLAGVPVTVKDLIAVQGLPFTFGSRRFRDEVSPVDAPSVARLRAAGACILGKTTTSELGSKAVGDSPLTGATRNPWNTSRTAGGSSAGAAAGVAARMSPLALGTDGGGSARIPASFCGVVGFKPTFGRVPVWPPSATPGLAHVGPIARSVSDAALLASVIEGHDRRDPFSFIVGEPIDAALQAGPAGAGRIAWCPVFGGTRASPEVERIVRKALDACFGDAPAEHELAFDADPAAIWNAEFYGGIRARLGGAAPMDDLDPALRAQLLAIPETSAAVQALQRQRLGIHARIEALFEHSGADFILSPTMPVPALPVGSDFPAGMRALGPVAWSFFTYPFNLSGHPALSIPAGLTQDGLPAGLQVVARKFEDAALLRFAHGLEQRIGFQGMASP